MTYCQLNLMYLGLKNIFLKIAIPASCYRLSAIRDCFPLINIGTLINMYINKFKMS